MQWTVTIAGVISLHGFHRLQEQSVPPKAPAGQGARMRLGTSLPYPSPFRLSSLPPQNLNTSQRSNPAQAPPQPGNTSPTWRDEEEDRLAGATPEDTDRLVDQAITQQDLEALLDLFEPDAVFVDPTTGAELRGHDQIRSGAIEMFKAKPRLEGTAGPPKV
jgi:hypothetical protein